MWKIIGLWVDWKLWCGPKVWGALFWGRQVGALRVKYLNLGGYSWKTHFSNFRKLFHQQTLRFRTSCANDFLFPVLAFFHFSIAFGERRKKLLKERGVGQLVWVSARIALAISWPEGFWKGFARNFAINNFAKQGPPAHPSITRFAIVPYTELTRVAEVFASL